MQSGGLVPKIFIVIFDLIALAVRLLLEAQDWSQSFTSAPNVACPCSARGTMTSDHHALGPRALPGDVKKQIYHLGASTKSFADWAEVTRRCRVLKPETEPAILNLGNNVHTLLSSKGK